MNTIDNFIESFGEALWKYLEPKMLATVGANANANQQRWLTKSEAMEMLHVGSTTLYKLCRDGAINFTQPTLKSKMYCRESIQQYLDKHTVK